MEKNKFNQFQKKIIQKCDELLINKEVTEEQKNRLARLRAFLDIHFKDIN